MAVKKGLVLDGGAHRAAFCAGALDFLADEGRSFDYVVSVAESSFGALCFLCKKRCKSAVSSDGSEDALWKRFLRGDWIHAITDYLRPGAPKELREVFDFPDYCASPTEHELVVSDRDAGTALYLSEKNSRERLAAICSAICSQPVLSPPMQVDGRLCHDGSFCDPLPVDRALQKGCDRTLFLLSKPTAPSERVSRNKKAFYGFVYHNYPRFCEALCTQPEKRDVELARIARLESEGKAFVVAPEQAPDGESMDSLYRRGYEAMSRRYAEYLEFLEK